MDNDNFSFLTDAESSITGDKTEGYTPKEQELIHQLVQERLGKKNAIEFESLDDYVVPPKMFFSMIKKPAVSIRANRMEFSMSAIRLFEGVQHVLPMLLILTMRGYTTRFICQTQERLHRKNGKRLSDTRLKNCKFQVHQAL